MEDEKVGAADVGGGVVSIGHTPGPWRWMGVALVGDHGRRPVVLMPRNDGPYVRGENGRLRPMEPADPDARLIAAAPDMLAALEEADGLLAESASVGDGSTFGSVRQTIQAALTKATEK